MPQQVDVEVIHRPNKRERRLSFIADSQRAAVEIARERSARTKANRRKYATAKNNTNTNTNPRV